jgi:transcriptional regulator of heat shock response
MDQRAELILKLIVDEYIRSAEPIGSKFIAEASELDVSPATVRTVMAQLERDGYLRQPHTSAGRVPTEKAYLHYLQAFVKPGSEPSDASRLRTAMEKAPDESSAMRTLAKTLVDLSGEMAVVAFGPEASYYTGVSNLFAKPDFGDIEVVRSLSTMLDRFDDVMGEMFAAVKNEPQVLIGQENPFGEGMSAVVVKYAMPNGMVGILGLVGPMRMDYGRNLGLVTDAIDLLNEHE